MKKTDASLSYDNAQIQQQIHKKQWDELLERYKKIEPHSPLFSSEHQWYNINASRSEKSKPQNVASNQKFFTGIVVGGFVVVSMLITYFMQNQEENIQPPTLNFIP